MKKLGFNNVEPNQYLIGPDKLRNLKQGPVSLLDSVQGYIFFIYLVGIVYKYGTLPYAINGAKFALSSTPEFSGSVYGEFSPQFLGNLENSFYIHTDFSMPETGYENINYANKSIYLINTGENDVTDGDGEISLLLWTGGLNLNG